VAEVEEGGAIMKGGAVVLAFFDREIVSAYSLLRNATTARFQDGLRLELACSVLIGAIREEKLVPSDALDRLTVLAIWGPAPLEFRLRLAEALAEVQDARIQIRARLQVEDAFTPIDRVEVAARLLQGPHGESR
jgi:hypothetical protein